MSDFSWVNHLLMNHSTRVYEGFDFYGLVLSQSKFQFWGRKLCETRKLRVLIWILRKFRIEFRIFRVLQNFGRRVVSGSGVCIRFRLVSKLQIILHAFSCHMHTCRRRRRRNRVQGDRQATGAAGQVQQENCEHPAQGPAEPVSSSSPKASPSAHPII